MGFRIRLPFLVAGALLAQQAERSRNPDRPGPQPLWIGGRPAEIRVTPVSDKTVRITVGQLDGRGAAAEFPDDPAIVARKWAAPVLRVRSVVAEARGLNVVVRTGAGIEIQVGDRQTLRIAGDTGALTFRLGSKPVYGLGQGGLQYARNGNKYQMTAGSVNLALNGMRMPVPWLISPEGWAILVNRPKGEFDLTGSEGIYTPLEGEEKLIDVFVSVAKDPPQLMKEYAGLTGFQTMPPLWTLGYQQSHRTVWDRDHVFRIVNNLREKKLPCDAVIYLGTGWCPSGWNEWHGSFDFHKKVFPNPPQDIAAIKKMNLKVVLHAVGNPARLYGSVNDEGADAHDANHVAEYWKLHQGVSKMIDGWWPDSGEFLDDASRMARIRMYWEGSQLDHPNVRPYALHRTGYAGMQRYGGWLWSGDVNSTWATLANHVAIGINTGLSGVPLWGSDIGGFFSTKELTGELYVRWFQFGAFCPSFRSHGRPSQTRFPWGWNTGEIGPEELDGGGRNSANPDLSELRNEKVEPICRKYLELRYRMMPYIYSAVRETHETGMPVIRALWLHYPDDAQAVTRADEYLFGRDVLVAPVAEKGATSRRLYLPAGNWYDLWTESKEQGGKEVTRPVDLETMPVYVRGGAIVPFGPVKQYTAQKSDAPVELVVYPGANGDFVLYNDDGVSFDFIKGVFTKIRCRWDDQARTLTLSLENGQVKGTFEARLAGSKQKHPVTFTGKIARVRL